ncbi:MAG: hypothetical protein JWP87_1684 [Labilithrix sp.]|nr:hypothetical protein [Labilithrix sp.]
MMRFSEIAGLILCAACGAAGCDSPATPPPAPARSDVSAAPLYVPPPPEGCARTGAIEAIDGDPTCVVAHAEETTRDGMKHLVIELKPDAPSVIAGGTSIFRLAITNTASTEAVLVFEATPPSSSPRPDWSRLAGVPEPKPVGSGTVEPDIYRLALPLRTLDAHEHPVDGLPSVSSPGLERGASPVPRLMRVRLRPGGKLTHTFTWWALRIPTPGPITRDDAGHRFVPKTAPIPLPAGEYVINAELPLHGISPPESIVSARVQVEKIEKPNKDAAP